MSGFSGGGFSFSRSGHRGGFLRHSHSHSGHGVRGVVGGLLGHSHSSGHRGHYAKGGHYRQVRQVRRAGCLGAALVGTALASSGLFGLVQLLT